MRTNHKSANETREVVALLKKLSRKLRKNQILDEDQLGAMLDIVRYRSNTNQTLLHIVSAKQRLCITQFITYTSTILKFAPHLMESYDDMQHTPLCTALSKVHSVGRSRTNHAVHIESIGFLISQGASCKPALKFEELHTALGIALNYKETFFHAVKNTFLESKIYEAHSLLYRWRIICKAAKSDILLAMSDAMETYFIEDGKRRYESFQITLRELLNLKSGKIIANPNIAMEELVQVKISGVLNNTGILHFICAMKDTPHHHMHQLEYLVQKLLQTKNIDVRVADYFGKTAVHLAASHGYTNIVSFIMQHPKYDFNAVDTMDNTPLHDAIMNKKTDTAQLLIEAGYGVNTPNSSSLYPLHIAVSKNNLEIVKLLLQNNASTNIKNQYNHTPLDLIEKPVTDVEKQIYCLLLLNTPNQGSQHPTRQTKQLPKGCTLL